MGTEEFTGSDIRPAIETHSDPVLASARHKSTHFSSAGSYTNMDSLRIQLPSQGDEKLLNMGMRLKKINKKECTKKEADLKVLRHKPRKSLFFVA